MEELKELSDNEIENARINTKLAISKGIINEEDYSLYKKVQSLYQKALDTYLLENTSLKEFDNIITNSDLDFNPIPVENRNPHHESSFLNLDYLYVRNFLFIEKLSEEQLTYFKNKINNYDFQIDEKLLEIVKESMPDVINDNYVNGEYKINASTCYGHVIPSNMYPSHKLAITLQYGRNEKYINGEEFFYNSKKKQEFLNIISKKIENNINEKIGIQSVVLLRDFVGE